MCKIKTFERAGIMNLKKTSPSAYMVRLYLNVQFQVKPLSTGTSSSQTKKKKTQKMFGWTTPTCVQSLESVAQV